MKSADGNSLIPENEAQRLRSLHSLGILDTPSEASLRNIAESVAMIFQTEVGIISFVDESRVFFKEAFGAPIAGRSVQRDESLCSVVVLREEITVFHDLASDPCRFIDPEVIERHGLRFYAGAPIKNTDGHSIGALAIADSRPRTFLPREKQILQNLAKVVMDELQLRKSSLIAITGLHHEVSDKTQQLLATRSELDQSQQELDNFLYRASHDLKGPLCTMAGLLNLAKLEVPDLSAREYFGKISNVTTRMNESLNKLVVIYSLIRDKDYMSESHLFEKKDVAMVIKGILHRFQDKIARKAITVHLSLSDEIELVISPQYLQLILLNLLENAVYFHRKIGERQPEIHIAIDTRNGNTTIRVADNGEGIPAEYRSRIFDLFFRGHNSARSGMGLYIVKRLVEKAGGEVHCSSKPGETTEFIVHLSRSAQAESA